MKLAAGSAALGLLLAALLAPSATAAPHRPAAHTARRAGNPTHRPKHPRPAPPPAAVPTVPATTGTSAPAGTAGSDGNWLAANGLTSPTCRTGQGLTARTRANCRRSGTVAIPVPIDRYGLDVHIDTGALGLSGGTLASVIQGVLVTPIWQAVLYATHGIVAALGWAYGLDLLNNGAMGPISRALAGAQRTLTSPWLGTALALAAVVLCWHALVRRRVSQSLGEAGVMLLMISGGLWIAAHPATTVGFLDKTVNQASLGTLAAVSTGDPHHAESDYATGLERVFEQTVARPWAFLEFGQVAWATDPHQNTRALFAERPGLVRRIVQDHGSATDLELLRAARTNGDLFLSFPTNTSARNSINRSDSLYHALCGASDDTHCQGPTASQAEFRTEKGTWPRVGGLMLILVGVIGMVCLLAFLAFRLLSAALLALFYLLLTPVIALVPVLGETGRNAFRAWGLRLLGAVLAKLLYSVFLGVTLLALGLLSQLHGLGWWIQWLLIACLWWALFLRRHQVVEFATLGHKEIGAGSLRLLTGLSAARQAAWIGSTLSGGRHKERHAGRAAAAAATFAAPREAGAIASRPPRPGTEEEPSESLDRTRDAQSARTLETEERSHHERLHAPPEPPIIEAGRHRLQGIQAARIEAAAQGDRRRELRLADRETRVRNELTEAHRRAGAQRRAAPAIERADDARYERGRPHTPEQRQIRNEWLDHQASLARGPEGDGEQRDYRRLAALTGHTETEYEALTPNEQRRVRAQADQALDSRQGTAPSELPGPVSGRRAGAIPSSRPRAPLRGSPVR